MSLKRHKRTRAEILAKRAAPITVSKAAKKQMLANGQTFYTPLARRTRHRSKYKPHIGVKEQERAKRLRESQFLNDGFVNHHLFVGTLLSPELFHDRSTPTLYQISRRDYVGEPY